MRAGAAGLLTAGTAIEPLAADACFDMPPAGGYPQQITIEPYDWGPGVSSTVFKVRQLIRPDSVQLADFVGASESKESYDWVLYNADHVILDTSVPAVDVYTCSADGERQDTPSRYLRMDFAGFKSDHIAIGGVFCFDPSRHKTTWCSPYTLEIQLTDTGSLSTVLGRSIHSVAVDSTVDFDAVRIPAVEPFHLDGHFTGSDGQMLAYADYEPAVTGTCPLVVWLHNGDEGGDDPRIPLLAERATALAESEFQGAVGGAAYVLVPQTERSWFALDGYGDWQSNDGKPSPATQVLKELIDTYIAAHPHVDADRIYIGGSGAGGYMTLNMLLQYPDMFAAAFPVSEYYRDAAISDAQLDSIRHIPLWFTYAQDDFPVEASAYTAATVKRLQALGAPVHVTAWEHAPADAMNSFYRTRVNTYIGHEGDWSWIYFFKGQCTDAVTGESAWQWLGEQRRGK